MNSKLKSVSNQIQEIINRLNYPYFKSFDCSVWIENHLYYKSDDRYKNSNKISFLPKSHRTKL